jgi:hypothetical protein
MGAADKSSNSEVMTPLRFGVADDLETFREDGTLGWSSSSSSLSSEEESSFWVRVKRSKMCGGSTAFKDKSFRPRFLLLGTAVAATFRVSGGATGVGSSSSEDAPLSSSLLPLLPYPPNKSMIRE